jgi:hypothetical protein
MARLQISVSVNATVALMQQQLPCGLQEIESHFSLRGRRVWCSSDARPHKHAVFKGFIPQDT